jgi:hypothetical protein
MFKKIGRLAGGLASNVSTSRRGFLGRIGQAALGVAGALGAVVGTASAGSGGVVCCKYSCWCYGPPYDKNICMPAGSTCVSVFWDHTGCECTLNTETQPRNCKRC